MATVLDLGPKLEAIKSAATEKQEPIAVVAQALIRRDHPFLAAGLMSLRYLRGVLLAIAVIIATITHPDVVRDAAKAVSAVVPK